MIFLNVICPSCKHTMSAMYVRMLINGELKFIPCGLLCVCGYHEMHLDEVNAELRL